ncbi:MAG: DUF4159 domain-containing protein [Candidatus Delongbacteria bacterium]|nr:DUF4159 domain-containing protein [Candidatus Delongbacteria bacterium]
MRPVIRVVWIWLVLIRFLSAQEAPGTALTICRLKYGGGGDWYNDRSMIPNLLQEFKRVTGSETTEDQMVLPPSDPGLFNYPILFMTGHGNVYFSDDDIRNLRKHLENGGFLYADDDYGMDKSFRREIKRIFPDKEFVQLPVNHPIYQCFYRFPNGLPKIHLHDSKPPEGWGIFHQGRLVLFYTVESNISDGWADPNVHNDPPEVRQTALKMGVNILYYALTF